jgi:cell fate (sporulation/competence/biofilm development) regulator YmcA (YheA/YmcA/DUF963 family)
MSVTQINPIIYRNLNLEDALDECEKKFQKVSDKLDSLDHRMDNLEDTLIDISNLLKGIKTNLSNAGGKI